MIRLMAVFTALIITVTIVGCGRTEVQSMSGIKLAKVGKIDTDANGTTVEQHNLSERIKKDNELGAIKHLYVFSAFSGQAIMYSPVKGKVTSGGKSLSPKKIDGMNGNTSIRPVINVGGTDYYVSELPNEDGTYGSGSSDYIFWFTPDGRFHQHWLSGGQIVHVSDEPMSVKSVIVNVESK